MPSSTSNSILILQFKVNGLKNHVNELQLVLQEKRIIDIALISETHFTKHSYVPITGYNLLKSNHPDNTAHGGAAIYISPPCCISNFRTSINLIYSHVPFYYISITYQLQ